MENLDKGKEIKFIFCNINKAFDKVWHDGLLYNLKKYGIDGTLFTWFKSYLSNRKQRVITEDCKSSWEDTLADVPHGSVLGPYLLLLYVNDIVENINVTYDYSRTIHLYSQLLKKVDPIKLLDDDLYSIANGQKTGVSYLTLQKPNR